MLEVRVSGVVWGSRWKVLSLSHNTSSTDFFCPTLLISQAVSMALRKPRPHPVPVGQNGYSRKWRKEERGEKGKQHWILGEGRGHHNWVKTGSKHIVSVSSQLEAVNFLMGEMLEKNPILFQCFVASMPIEKLTASGCDKTETIYIYYKPGLMSTISVNY